MDGKDGEGHEEVEPFFDGEAPGDAEEAEGAPEPILEKQEVGEVFGEGG